MTASIDVPDACTARRCSKNGDVAGGSRCDTGDVEVTRHTESSARRATGTSWYEGVIRMYSLHLNRRRVPSGVALQPSAVTCDGVRRTLRGAPKGRSSGWYILDSFQ